MVQTTPVQPLEKVESKHLSGTTLCLRRNQKTGAWNRCENASKNRGKMDDPEAPKKLQQKKGKMK